MYIADLMTRFQSKESLPQTGQFPSSADSVSWRAHREAEKIATTVHFAECAKIVDAVCRQQDIIDIAFIVSRIIANTHSQEFAGLYARIPYQDCDAEALMYLISGATKAGLASYRPIVDRMVELKFKVDLHLPEAIEYYGQVIGLAALPVIGDLLDHDCWGRCFPFYCCVELGNIGSQDAIPYLTRAIARNKSGRKGLQRDVVHYADAALKRLSGTVG